MISINSLSFKILKPVVAAFLSLFLVTAAAPAQDGETAAPNPALWKLADADSEIWLFGTVHVLNPALEWRTRAVDAAFETADAYYMEAPVADAEPATMQPLIAKYGLNTTGMPFSALIGDEARANTIKALAMLGQPAQAMGQFDALRPWLVGITLQALQIQARGGDPEAGVDKILWYEASAAGKTLGYFETIEEQLKIFGDMSTAEEVAFYEEGIRQFVEQPDLLDRIVADWVAGDIDGLADKIAQSMGEDQDMLYDTLITARNRNWAHRIKALMDGSGRIFIAVGAGHLAGPGSVQDQLAELGLMAERQ